MTDSLKYADADFAGSEAALLDAFNTAVNGFSAGVQSTLQESQGGDSEIQRLLVQWYWQGPRAYAYAYFTATHSELGGAEALLSS